MIKLITKNDEKLSFITSISESLANAIRRSALEIPILAIDEVEIFKNDSALYDEILAHRLGLVPLVTEKEFVESENCSCKGKGCNKCSASLKIQTKGPVTVYSKDLKGRTKAVHDGIPIVILDKDQEIELVATAKLGKGITHSKYSPGLVYYRNVAKITFDKNCDECEKCIESCPQKILSKQMDKIGAKDIYKCDLCEACVESCKAHGKNAIKIEKSPELLFFIESWGQIKAKDIFLGAIDKLGENLKELSKAIK
jgi:DNA-directed RNA polymerase subunit D